jgi:magnesium-transporting ATPase (P-type)
MAVVATCVRVSGGLVVAFFKYMGDRSLYQLLVAEGTVEVLRGGEVMTIDQTDVVPGDIVRLVVSRLYPALLTHKSTACSNQLTLLFYTA